MPTRSRQVTTSATVVFVLAVGACSHNPGTPVATGPPSPTAAVTSAPATPAAPAPGSSGPVPSTAAPEAAVPTLNRITVMRTGGIAGVMQQVVVTPDGRWVHTDRRTGRTRQGRLTDAQRAEIARLAADPALAGEARAVATRGAACNDAFAYAVTVGELTIRYDQCPGAGARPVTERLVAAVLDATPM
jgi:hypothetical protein